MVFRTRAEQFPAFKITYTSLECGLDISLCFFIKLFGFLFRFHVVLLQRMLFNYHVIQTINVDETISIDINCRFQQYCSFVT